MEYKSEFHPLGEGMTGVFVQTDRFKTRRMTISLALPVTAERSARAALLSRLLSRSSAAYPSHILLSRHLADMYGAGFASHCIRVGDFEVLNLSVSALEDAYALEGEPLSQWAQELLEGALFAPHLTNGLFDKEEFESEKRQLIETVEGLINDKRTYALEQAQQLLFPGEPAGVPDSGGLEAVRALTNESVAAFWKELLQTAQVQITVVGQRSPQELYERLKAAFAACGRQYVPFAPTRVRAAQGEASEKIEPMAIAQGKLVMGFLTGGGQGSSPDELAAMRMMTDLWGGAPYSRLFTVVREQMSLCYYCAARFQTVKGAIMVDSGIEVENAGRTREGILSQLRVMQEGGFDDDALSASRKGLSDSARGVGDSAAQLEAWYIHRMFDPSPDSPEDFVRRIEGMTREDIAAAARKVALGAVYFLKGEQA